MQEYAKPIEGVDYAISRPDSGLSGGASFNAKGSNVVDDNNSAIPGTKKRKPSSIEDKDDTDGTESVNDTDTDADRADEADDSVPTPPPLIRIPNEKIKVQRRVLVTANEARQIIFAQGTLKSEGSIDGVPE
jgi:hypothetical protein